MKYLVLKEGLVIAEFYNKGYALDFIDYQATLGKEFTLEEVELTLDLELGED